MLIVRGQLPRGSMRKVVDSVPGMNALMKVT